MVCKMKELKGFSEVHIRFKKAVELRPDENIWLRLYPDGRYQIMSGQEPMVSFEHAIEEGRYV